MIGRLPITKNGSETIQPLKWGEENLSKGGVGPETQLKFQNGAKERASD